MLEKLLLNFLNVSFCDAAESWQLGLQDPASPAMEGIINFHNYIMIFLITIGVFVLWMLYRVMVDFDSEVHPIPEKFTHSSALEIIWTILPAVVLMFIAVPSFGLLYSLDELIDPTITLKIVGHQWYWSYEYSDYATLEGGESLNFDSYLVATSDLTLGSFRLLEVDNRVVLPTNTHIRLLLTAADVLHCWSVPSFGVKIDACPGRLSQASLFIKREGTYYGQCSEICGVNHGFMPIVVRGVSVDNFVKWIGSKLEDLTITN
jgi:cytochrome c oxidase subunit 2